MTPSVTVHAPSESERRAALRRMRAVATGLLVLAAVVYLLTTGRGGILGYVSAGAEASMVGAVADWFAVTALFRHPLGLPIPHTAIIPRRKDALGIGLETFVADNFLTRAVVTERYAQAQVARRAGEWLAEPEHAATLVRHLSPLVARVVRRMKPDDVQTFLETVVLPRLAEEEVSPTIGTLLDQVVRQGSHASTVGRVFRELHVWAVTNQATVVGMLQEKAPWWTPPSLDQKVGERVHREMVAWLAAARDDENHPARAAFDDYLLDLARALREDDQMRERVEALKVRVLERPETCASMLKVWDSLSGAALGALENEDGHLRLRLADAVQRLGEQLAQDEGLQRRVDGAAQDVVGTAVETYGGEVVNIISTTIGNWDAKEAADNIESHVGRDLQFIRINGTVVGGLVGVLIHALTQVAGA